jgi:hypothetical protein
MSSAESKMNQNSKGVSIYPTTLEGRTGVIEEKHASGYKHFTRRKMPEKTHSSRVVPSEHRQNRESVGTGIYDNVLLTDRTGVRVDLHPDAIKHRNNLKRVRSEILNNPTSKNINARKVVQDQNLLNKIYRDLLGGKTKNKRSQKTKSRNFRKTRHRSRV